MKFKNYRNPYTNDNRIYSFKDLYDMPFGEVIRNEQEVLGQYRVLGVPTEIELQGSENVIWVDAYTRDDGTEVKGHWRSKPEGSWVNIHTENKSNAVTITGGASEIKKNNAQENPKNEENTAEEKGSATGCASKIEREEEPSEIKDLPKNNDDFFEKERNNPQSVLMRVNYEKNVNRPDAKLFMDIALVGPKNVPSTQDYQFVSSEHNKELNEKYSLTGNKEIPSHYDGFEFSKDSPTAQALNNSDEFKNQILSSKNYDSMTGKFKTDKLEIEFNNDKNLQYSFGHMTILEPKIENGYITGTGYDKYNYETMYGKKFENVSQETKSLNNKARFLQAAGKLKNYYVLIPVKIKM